MRIDIKKVNGKEYLQYVDFYGHVFHIGPTDKLINWKIAFWLYGYGLNEMQLEFEKKMIAEAQKRFSSLDISSLERNVGKGMNGYVGFEPTFKDAINRIFDVKAIELDQIRNAVRQKFPDIKMKEALRATVVYNYRRKNQSLPE